METSIPVFLLMLVAVAGAAYMMFAFRAMKRSKAIGGVVGAVVSVAGSLLLMLPLGFCTFEAGRSRLDRGFGIFLLLLGAGIGLAIGQWVLRLWWQEEGEAFTDSATQGSFKLPWIVPLLLLAPTLSILLIFIYYPALDTFRLATRLARLSTPRTQFVCVRNFTEIIAPSYSLSEWVLFAVVGLGGIGLWFWRHRLDELDSALYRWLRRSFWVAATVALYVFIMGLWSEYYRLIFFNTILISTVTVVAGLGISLALSVLVYQPIQGAGIYRTLLIWSYAISPAVAGIIFAIMFNPVAGIANHILETWLNLPRLPWLTNAWLARSVLILASIWKQLGYNILFYIAGLQTVPKDLMEAATLDGANRWQRFRTVVLPALSPITFFLVITNLTYTFFEIYGTIDYLTRGGPNGATSVAIYEIIRVGIRADRDLGRAAAQSIILFILVIGVTLLQFRTSGRRVTYNA
jgi:sn-glycerol 3-phosphate transport system permease protein